MEDALEIFCFRLTPLSNDSFLLSLLQVQYSLPNQADGMGERWLELKKTTVKNVRFLRFGDSGWTETALREKKTKD